MELEQESHFLQRTFMYEEKVYCLFVELQMAKQYENRSVGRTKVIGLMACKATW